MDRLWHPIEELTSDDTVLWRYMDRAKFQSLCGTGTLHLARSDQFLDKCEGFCPDAQLMTRHHRSPLSPPADPGPELVVEADAPLQSIALMRLLTFVSCWHRAASESDAMWGLYCKSTPGVAVLTTVGRLASAVVLYQKKVQRGSIFRPFEARLGHVRYVEPGLKEKLPVEASDMFFLKRLAYEHEKETRLVVQAGVDREYWKLPLEVRALVASVVTMPYCDDSFFDEIVATAGTASLHGCVRRSELETDPGWHAIEIEAAAARNQYLALIATLPNLYPAYPIGDPNRANP